MAPDTGRDQGRGRPGQRGFEKGWRLQDRDGGLVLGAGLGRPQKYRQLRRVWEFEKGAGRGWGFARRGRRLTEGDGDPEGQKQD